MKVAHILPPKVVDQVPAKLLNDYSLILPSLFQHQTYRNFYRKQDGYMILDNGAAEGKRESLELICNMGRAMLGKVDEIVLPDVIGNMDGTLDAIAQEYYTAFEYRTRFKFMMVLQGKTFLDYLSCAERAINMFGGLIHAFGVPRHILSTLQNTTSKRDARLRLARELLSRHPNKAVHLLGTNPAYPYELLEYGQQLSDIGVRGVDTSMAWNAALSGTLLDPKGLNYNINISRQPIEGFYEAKLDPKTETAEFLFRNMEVMNSWVN